MILVTFTLLMHKIFTEGIDLTAKYADYLLHPTSEYDLTMLGLEVMYSEFVQIYQKVPNQKRKEIFFNTVSSVIAHNSDPERTWTKGLNQYSDMTHEEFSQLYLLQEPQNCSATETNFKLSLNHKIPKHRDWRKEGGVSSVKNQGHCGSCWTFSTTGCMEAHYRIYEGNNVLFSEQQLVDCAGDFDTHGCKGGLPSHAFEYIRYNGITSEDKYPYQAKDQKCTYDKSLSIGHTHGSYNITANDESSLHKALAYIGPVSVAFQVVDGFKEYRSGVYQSEVCKNGPQDVNHAVLAVGYETEGSIPYYIVKNSWAESWGNQGYFWIQANTNMCGIAQCNSFPNIGQLELITDEGMETSVV